MSYSAGIIAAITGLKDRTGSSSIAIKKTMQASMPKDKKWMNATFLAALKKMVADGVLVQNKGSYKLGAKAKKAPKKKATAPKKKAAPKKKSAPKKKAAPKKKSAPKKKATTTKPKATKPKKAAAPKKPKATKKKAAPKKAAA